MIFNQAQDATKNSGMSQAQVSTFNNKFSKYEGKKIKGSEVNGMIQEVVASNGDEDNQNASRIITVMFGTAKVVEGTAVTNNTIQSNKTYTVSISEYDSNGYVKKIQITAANANDKANN